MIDAYEIGITLALQNGVSEGLASVRHDLGALDQAIATTARGLAQLQVVANGTVAGSEVEFRRGAVAAGVRQPLSLGVPGSAFEPEITPARAAARVVERENAPPTRMAADEAWRPNSVQTVAPIPAVSAPLIIPVVSASAAAPTGELPRAVNAPVVAEAARSERAVAPELKTGGSGTTRAIARPLTSVVVMPPPTPVAVTTAVARSGSRPQTSQLSQPASIPPRVVLPPPAAPDLAAFARAMSPGIRGEVTLPAGVPSRLVETRGGEPRNWRAERTAVPVARPEVWPEVKWRSVAPVAAVAEARAAERAASGTAAERALTAGQQHKPANGPVHGDVFFDGTLVGRWMADRMTRNVDRPPSGPTGFDARRSAAWPGATVNP